MNLSRKRFVIVEGKSDRAVIWRQLKDTGITVRSLGGKNNVVEFARLAQERDIVDAMAIVDRNGWLITGFPAHVEELHGTSLASTELRDLEMDLLALVGMDAIVAEYFDTDKIMVVERRRGMRIDQVFVEAAAPIGALRVANEIHESRLNFQGLLRQLELEDEYLLVNLDSIMSALIRRHPRAPWEALRYTSEKFLASHSAGELACGHDVMEVAALAASGELGLGGRSVRRVDLERMLRVSSALAVFEDTAVGRAIGHWAMAN